MPTAKLSFNLTQYQETFKKNLYDISSNLEKLKEGELNTSQQNYIKNLERAKNKLLALLHQLNISNSTPQKKQISILMIEDDPFATIVNREILKRIGCHVETTQSGEEGLLMVDKGFDLILVDIGLPGMSGVQFAEELIKKQKEQIPKIIAITAHKDEMLEKRASKNGIQRVLIKPVTINQFENLINELQTELLSGEKL